MYVEKKSKWKIVVTVILILALIGGGVFLGFNYYQKEEQKKKEKTPIKEEKKDTTQPLSESQINYVLTKINTYDGMLPYGAFDQNNLNQEQALRFVDSVREKEYVDFTKGVSFTKVKNILERYFGKKVHFLQSESTCQDQNVCFFFDSENERYIKLSVANYPYKTMNFYVQGTQDKETKNIQIQVRQIYYVLQPEERKPILFYNSVESAMNNQAPLFNIEAIYGDLSYRDAEYKEAISQQVQANALNIPLVTYYFVYQTGGYYLEKVER